MRAMIILLTLLSGSPDSLAYAFDQDGFRSNMTQTEVSLLLQRSAQVLVGPLEVGTYEWYRSSKDDRLRFYFCHSRLTIYSKPLDDFPSAIRQISDWTAEYGQGLHEQDYVRHFDVTMTSLQFSWDVGLDNVSVNIEEDASKINSTEQFVGAGYNISGLHIVPSYNLAWTRKAECH